MFDFLILEVHDRPITVIGVNLVVCFKVSVNFGFSNCV